MKDDIADLFRMPPRSVVSFSGGRTSGYMLRRVLDAHGGSLPEDVVVLFCNTGKEREETLVFVEECQRRWAVPIVWLEYRYKPFPYRQKKDGTPLALDHRSHSFEVVTFETASRNGEPFIDAIKARNDFRRAKGSTGLLPHVRGRYCTAELKTRSKGRFIKQVKGWQTYHNAIGIRADEPKRIARLTGCEYREDASCRGERPLCPLFSAGVTEADVMAFWGSQPFDLELRQHEGNCDLCFLKSKAKLFDIIHNNPGIERWWAEREEETGDVFRLDRPRYVELPMYAAPLEAVAGDCDLSDACDCTD